MDLKTFTAQLTAGELTIPVLKEGKKVKGTVLKKI